MKNNKAKIQAYILSVIIALAVGVLSALVSGGKMEEYYQLVQPPLAPPAWVFPAVWTVLFILMGISAAMVYRSDDPGRSDALFLYGTQLAVNLLWTVFYFRFGARLLAFFWLLFLLALVLMMSKRFYDISKTAGKLQIPYIVWIVFAGYLNLATYFLNR
ncbi:MAG: TspO/MBR family protein [Oscillospiraceae bacterium]